MEHDDLRRAILSEALIFSRADKRIIAADELTENPWLFDLRALFLQPKWLKRYAEIFWATFDGSYPFQICGMESAAIALVSAIALEGLARGKPVNGLFVRKSRKRSGLMKRLEGTPTKDPVILVDDLINSGRTFKTQLDVLEREGLSVSSLFSLIAFREPEEYTELFGGRRLHTTFSLKDFGLSMPAHPAEKPAFTELWHFTSKEPAYNLVVQKSAPATDGERVYFGTDRGTFFALDTRDGSVAWQLETGPHPRGKGIFSSPALHNGIVYFGAYDGNTYALDAKTGEKKWLAPAADWIGSSPALAPEQDMLFIGLEFGLRGKRGGIAALKMSTGELLWQARHPEFTHGSPLYIAEENIVVIGSNDDTVYAYRATTGALVWKYKTRGSVKSSFAYDAKRKLILFGSLGGVFYALGTDGTPVFAREFSASVYSTPLVHEGVAYVSSLDKFLHAVDLSNGTEKWRFLTNGRIFASPVLIESSLFIGSNDGRLYEVSQNGKGGPVFQSPERIVNRIAYDAAAKLFFVATFANELVCLRRL